MKLTICQRIGLCVAAWTISLLLALSASIGLAREVAKPWMLVSLSVAITMSMSLMLWRLQSDLHRDITGDDHSEADVLHLAR